MPSSAASSDKPQRDPGDVQATFDAAFARSPLPTAVTQGERHTVRCLNAAWLELAGGDGEPGLGQPFVERFPELASIELTLLDRVYRTGEAAQLADPRPQEELRFTMMAWPWGVPASGAAMIVIQIVETKRHALERVRMEEIAREMREINERLILGGIHDRDVSERRAERLAGVEAESRAKSTFVSTVSHELRTPLNALIGYLELMAEGLGGPLTQKQIEMLQRMRVSALHLMAVIQQILTFSRTEAGQMEVHPETIDVVALVREAALLVGPLLQKEGLSFQLRAPDHVIEVRTDPALLKQVLINLLNNAIKFTDRGQISLDIEADTTNFYCAVRDTGVGIPADQLERIFEPFHQVQHDQARPLEGTGLGLAVSRRLIRLLGGDITVQSRPDEGSTFTVRCPLRPAHLA
jgi:signal transduction histidine kinase